METIAEVIRTAREYSRLIELHRKIPLRRFLDRIEIILARLYAGALQLPSVDSEEKIEDRMTQEEWSKLFLSPWSEVGAGIPLLARIRSHQKGKALAGSLADGFADIYRDIKPALVAYSKGSKAKRKAAIWQWRFGLDHWGRHACWALSALRELRAKRRFRS